MNLRFWTRLRKANAQPNQRVTTEEALAAADAALAEADAVLAQVDDTLATAELVDVPESVEAPVKRPRLDKKNPDAYKAHLVEGAPIFLMVGSISGCSAKDARLFARGLAEQYVATPALGRMLVQEDKANHRYVFEIHEGGPGHSILAPVLAALADDQVVSIQLTNGARVTIQDENEEIFSLVYPKEEEGGLRAYNSTGVDDDVASQPIQAYCTSKVLPAMYPVHDELPVIARQMLIVCGMVFLATSTIYSVVSSGIFDADQAVSNVKSGYIANLADNPVTQLGPAVQEAKAIGNRTVRKLQKDEKKGWSYEFGQ